MKIDKLSNYSIKISLDEIDFLEYHLQYDNWNNENATDFLLEISDEIEEETNLDITNQKLFVEIFSRKNSCLIFISINDKTSIQNQKISRISFIFKNYSSLKELCFYISDFFPKVIKSSKLFYNPNYLRLTFETNDPVNILESCNNFVGHIFDETTDAFISEYDICIQESYAINKIMLF